MPTQAQLEKLCAAAVATLIDWQGGSIAELARVAGVSRVAAFKWGQSGRVGEGAAVLLGSLPGAPLTPQQIRPDLNETFASAYMTKETKAAIKVQAAYIKQRDADKLKAEAAAAREANKGAPQRKTRQAKRVKA